MAKAENRKRLTAGSALTAAPPTRPKPWDLVLLSTAALILISVGRLHAFVPGLAAIRPGLILTLLSMGALALNMRGPRKLKHLKSPLAFLMVFFVAWAIAGAPFALYPGRAVGYLFDQFLREAVVIVIITAAIRDLTDLKRIVAVFAFAAVTFAVLGQGSGGRALGGGGYDANDSAMFVVSAMPVVFYFLVRAEKTTMKVVFGLGLVACASAVVLSGSRGGFLGLVAVIVYSLFFLRGIKPTMRIGVVGMAVAVLAFQADAEFWERMQSMTDESDYNYESYTGRKQIWTRGVGYVLDNPVLGVGIDNFSIAEGQHPDAQAMLARGQGVKFSAPHSIWVQTAAETGIPGIAALIAMFVVSFRYLWRIESHYGGRLFSDDQDLRKLGELGRPLVGVLVAVVVSGTFLSRSYSTIVWMPLALTLGAIKVGQLREKQLKRATTRAQAVLHTQRNPATSSRDARS